jgi:Icc protein
MLILGHITDPHLNGTADRRDRLANALDEASRRNVGHLLLTGDLTANGAEAHMRELGSVLDDHWPGSATIVGGNHDGAGFNRHFMRYLGRFSSASTPGQPVIFNDAVVVPVDTYYPSRAFLFRALGNIGKAQLARLQAAVQSTQLPVVLAMHHGPQVDPLRHFAGLTDRHHLTRILGSYPNVSVCCGHDHRVLDSGSIHVAASCASHPDPLRVYAIQDSAFVSSYRSPCEGTYLGSEANCRLD